MACPRTLPPLQRLLLVNTSERKIWEREHWREKTGVRETIGSQGGTVGGLCRRERMFHVFLASNTLSGITTQNVTRNIEA